MTSTTSATLPASTATRTAARAMVPTLIRVPALRAPRRRRRRLRREVRLCGLALLFGAPLAYLALGSLGLRPRSAEAVTTDAAPPPLSVMLLAPELESGTWGGGVGTESGGPVVLPTGYLLPEMTEEPQEDAAHAGT